MEDVIWCVFLFFLFIWSFLPFNILIFIVFGFFLIMNVLGKVKAHNEKRYYSRSGDDFGGNFSDSSGGIYYGDGFKGINGRFGDGLR